MVELAPEILQEAPVLFDDVRVGDLDPEAHGDFIIARVLDRGTLRSVRALFHVYGHDRIRRFFVEGGAPQLARRTVPLWASFFELTADECTSKSSPRRRSPYWSD